MAENCCTIELLGTSISISTEEEVSYVQNLVKRVDSVVQEVKDSLGLSDPLSVAIMAAIFLADECVRLQGNQGVVSPLDEFFSMYNLSPEAFSDLQVRTGNKLAHIESVLDRTLRKF